MIHEVDLDNKYCGYNYATGIYSITNLVNGKRYIGSCSRELRLRLKHHRSMLISNKHPNVGLQKSWNKHGKDKFRFEVIKLCPPEWCLQWEQFCIEFFDVTDKSKGYNLSPTTGGVFGIKLSVRTRKKMSRSHLGIKMPAGTGEKISKSLKGHTKYLKWRKSLSEAGRRRKHPEEVKRKISESLINNGGAQRISLANKGRKHSEEAKAKISAANKGKPKSLEHKLKIGLSNRVTKSRLKTVEV